MTLAAWEEVEHDENRFARVHVWSELVKRVRALRKLRRRRDKPTARQRRIKKLVRAQASRNKFNLLTWDMDVSPRTIVPISEDLQDYLEEPVFIR